MGEPCTLCGNVETNVFAQKENRLFYGCSQCDLKFVASASRISPEEERKRYELHQNDVQDPGYQAFVRPLVEAVLEFKPLPATGLDFGAGQGPVAAHLLTEKGYDLTLYDPFFHANSAPLERTYDYILCSEVVEHFFHPEQEFKRLKTLLRKEGTLFVMTDLWREQITFTDWHYMRDLTHVSFYSYQTFEWIREKFGFSNLLVRENRLIVLFV